MLPIALRTKSPLLSIIYRTLMISPLWLSEFISGRSLSWSVSLNHIGLISLNRLSSLQPESLQKWLFSLPGVLLDPHFWLTAAYSLVFKLNITSVEKPFTNSLSPLHSISSFLFLKHTIYISSQYTP